jgi:hypothetical protein
VSDLARATPLPGAMMLLALLALTACPLQPGFEQRLDETYHCGPHWVVAHDAERTVRAQLAIDLGDVTLTEEFELEQAAGDFAEGSASFAVYVGTCISVPECSDVISSACSQVLHHQYEARSGRADVEVLEDRTIRATIRDAVLVGTDGEEEVTLDAWQIPLAPRGSS